MPISFLKEFNKYIINPLKETKFYLSENTFQGYKDQFLEALKLQIWQIHGFLNLFIFFIILYTRIIFLHEKWQCLPNISYDSLFFLYILQLGRAIWLILSYELWLQLTSILGQSKKCEFSIHSLHLLWLTSENLEVDLSAYISDWLHRREIPCWLLLDMLQVWEISLCSIKAEISRLIYYHSITKPILTNSEIGTRVGHCCNKNLNYVSLNSSQVMRELILEVEQVAIHVIWWKNIWLNVVFDNFGKKSCT